MNEAPQSASAGSLPDNAPHALVVDDDQRIRDLLSRYLMNNGFRVTPAADAAAARAAMKGLSFVIPQVKEGMKVFGKFLQVEKN